MKNIKVGDTVRITNYCDAPAQYVGYDLTVFSILDFECGERLIYVGRCKSNQIMMDPKKLRKV